MAERKTERARSGPALPDFADDAYYRVQLRRSVQYAGRTLSPAGRQVIRGDLAKKIAAAIHTAEPHEAL